MEAGPSTGEGSTARHDLESSSRISLRNAASAKHRNTIRLSRANSEIKVQLKEALEKMQRKMTQGSEVSEVELLDIVNNLSNEKRQRKLYQNLLIGAIVVVLIMIGALSGISAAIVAAYKDIKAYKGMLADYNGHMLKTAPSTATLPMYTAPVLDPTQLASIESLQVSVPHEEAEGGRLSRYMRIRRVDHYSSTRIKFHLEDGSAVQVWDGRITLEAVGSTVPVNLCGADLRCASFEVDTARQRDDYIAQADAALATLRMTDELPEPSPSPSSRRLDEQGTCQDGCVPNWGQDGCSDKCCCAFPDWGADGELTVTGQCNIFSWGTQCRPACAADAISCQLGLPSGQCQAGGEPAVPRRVECGRVGKCAGGEWANPTDTYMVRCCAETRLSSSWKQYANCDVWSESNGPEIGGCMRDKTLLEAEAICASAGARLCSAAELLADCARGTGCGFDSQLVWASDEQSLPDPAPGPLPGPAPDPQPMPTPVPAPDPQPTPAPAPDPNGDGSTCPPQGWERCGTTWPPLTTGYCCSAGGWYGITDDHCNPSKGGINALASCCAYNNDPNHPDYTYGMLVCSSQCDAPPAECTGVPAIDSVLAASDIGCQIGLTQLNDVYTWAGFCSAVRQFNAIGDRKLLLGDTEDPNGAAFGLSNVAALLAQCMWESGGEAPFTACDENDYPPSSPTASCTQRSDGELYHSLNDQPWACYVDPQMTMTAETWASWAPGPLKCVPGTGSEKCCWWGRGAIQTTGPNNYGLLQREVFSKVPALGGIDLCTNPEAICQRDDAKWLGAIFYWANNVQGFGLEAEAATFAESLRKFVESGFDRSASVVAGADFAAGTGGVVNNGYWSARPHGHNERLRYFDFIVAQLKAAGMQTVGIPRPPPSPKPPPPSPPRRPKPSPPPGGTSGGGSGNSGGGGGGIDCVNQPLTGSFSAYSCETYEEMICSGWPETGPSGMCGYCQYDDVADNCCKCRS